MLAWTDGISGITKSSPDRKSTTNPLFSRAELDKFDDVKEAYDRRGAGK